MTTHQQEIDSGDRFQFGANWKAFLKHLDQQKIDNAVVWLQEMLGLESLQGKTFLDIGCGSGLYSLAARYLGAKVHSLDFDPQSVVCANEIRGRFFPDDADWSVEEGSALDSDYIKSLGAFDIVFSWGVLHHTGNMQLALENAMIAVNPGGILFISIYNDQGFISRFWTRVKKIYCSSLPGRVLVCSIFFPLFFVEALLMGIVKHGSLFGRFTQYKNERGMTVYYDWLDWLGGYPFEVAKIEELFHLYHDRGFELINLVTTNRMGCNQLVFRLNEEQ